MQKKRCPNGHVYDPGIYGDQCPLCPPGVTSAPSSGPETHLGSPAPGSAASAGFGAGGLHTHIATSPAQMPDAVPQRGGGMKVGNQDPSGATMMRPQSVAPNTGAHTVIRHAGRPSAGGTMPSRKLVGFLVSYNRDPNGKSYNLYEGRNFIGRDSACDISVPDDDQMSGRHLSILYRNVDNRFKFRDEQSSNGTFVNKELLDDGTLENYDIIRAGGTIFIFIAIPNIS